MRAVLYLLIATFGFGGQATATVEGWEIVGEPSRVAVNYSSNHGYYPRSWPFAFRYQAAALEAVRRDLVLKGQLENEPILVQIPDKGFTSHPRSTHLSLETVALQRGDGETLLPARRYVIHWNDDARPDPTMSAFFDGLLHLTLNLQELSANNRESTITDWSRLRREYSSQAASYKNIVQHFDPIWSPDGRFLIFTSWQNARADFYVLALRQRVLWKLNALERVPACRPVWSEDGQYVAYADLKSVKIFQTNDGNSQRFALPFADKHNPHELLLNFRIEKGKNTNSNSLSIAGDTNLFHDYVVLNYVPAKRQLRERSVQPQRPEWAGKADQAQLIIERRKADSPAGDWSAVIEGERGLRRLVLRARESSESFRVLDLPVKVAPASQVISLAPTTSSLLGTQDEKEKLEEKPDGAVSPPQSPAPSGQISLFVALAAILAGMLFFLFKVWKRVKH